MKFNPKLSWEFLSADEIAAKTLRALRNQIKHIKEVSPYYKEAFWDINPDDIKHLDDFHRLPFTGRTSLTEHRDKFIALDVKGIVEMVATAGATGQPILCPLSANDIDRLAFSQALSFNSMGIDASDRALLFTGFDRCSLSGMGCYRGLMHLGAQTARAGIVPHDLARQYIDEMKPTLLAGSPLVLRRLAMDLANAGFNAKESMVTKLICLGESLKGQDMEMNSVGRKLQELWGAQAFVSYALTEVTDALCECSQQSGTHSHPELIYLEIVDEAGRTVPEGTPGELVVTSLGIEAMPLVRYRTGDITFTVKGTCPCERHSVRIGPILGRSTEIIRLKSRTVYPLVLTNALDELDEIKDYVIILESDDPRIDRVSIHAATQPSAVEKIAAHVRAAVQVTFPILISNSTTIQSMRGVSQRNVRIIDWRQQSQRGS
ncbi:MAG: AMP-binding protein [Chitinispirillaceae bacterium]|nr:AMP-binding protein [Chitinispirillaceae bacterium]